MSTYCVRSDIENTFGVKNVERWAALEDGYTAAQITTRINTAISVASEEIDDVLRFAQYEIPAVTPGGTTAPTTITQLCADMAGVWLYESRGVDDVARDGTPVHKLMYIKARAEAMLEKIGARTRKINTQSNTG